MIKKIQYVDYGYMPNSMEVKPTDQKVSGPTLASFMSEAYFRVGWIEEENGKIFLTFYTPEEMQAILKETESLTLRDLVGREIEVALNKDGLQELVKYLK